MFVGAKRKLCRVNWACKPLPTRRDYKITLTYTGQALLPIWPGMESQLLRKRRGEMWG